MSHLFGSRWPRARTQTAHWLPWRRSPRPPTPPHVGENLGRRDHRSGPARRPAFNHSASIFSARRPQVRNGSATPPHEPPLGQQAEQREPAGRRPSRRLLPVAVRGTALEMGADDGRAGSPTLQPWPPPAGGCVNSSRPTRSCSVRCAPIGHRRDYNQRGCQRRGAHGNVGALRQPVSLGHQAIPQRGEAQTDARRRPPQGLGRACRRGFTTANAAGATRRAARRPVLARRGGRRALCAAHAAVWRRRRRASASS